MNLVRVRHSVMQNIKAHWKNVISPTLVATLILLITLWLFGLENSMIAPFATISYLRFIRMKNHYECMVKHFVRYAVMACAAYVAVMNVPLCIVVNCLVLFWIAFYLIDEYHPVNHLPIGMALIFFQISAIHTPGALMNRLSALGVSFIIIFLFVMVVTLHDRKKDPFHSLIEEGFSYAAQLPSICCLGDEDAIRALHLNLRSVNRRLSEEI